jgi:DNA-binding PadR family transcriptional regulator
MRRDGLAFRRRAALADAQHRGCVLFVAVVVLPPSAFSKRSIDTINFFAIIKEMAERLSLGEFELVVMLVVMRLGDDAYGVPISREIEQQTGRAVAFGTVYATLERLQKKGLVCSRLGETTPERGGRAKRYFEVTPTGVRTVRETKQTLVRLWQGLRQLQGGIA